MSIVFDTPRPCHGKAYIFYGKSAERPERRDKREALAKKVCSACPVAIQCRDIARKNKEQYGVWGGETERERHMAGYAVLPSYLLRGERDKVAV
jgi:WhiB family redox-sensing transcriptional regulator